MWSNGGEEREGMREGVMGRGRDREGREWSVVIVGRGVR